MSEIDGVHSLYVDESQRPGLFLLCAVAVPVSDQPEVRKQVRKLRPKHSNRLHMHQESRVRRLAAIGLLRTLGQCTVYVVETDTSRKALEPPRPRTLRSLLIECTDGSTHGVVLARTTLEQQDKRLASAVRKTEDIPIPDIRHESPLHEPLLWLPDIAAWALGRKDEYRRMADFPNVVRIAV